MNEIIIHALANSVKLGQMTIEQVPIPFKEAVQEQLEL